MLQAASSNFAPLHLSAPDARAEGAQRQITLHPRYVHIHRRMAGITMNIAVRTQAYHGVLLSLVPTSSGAHAFCIRLVHGDAELDVILAEGLNEAIMDRQWRDWAQNLALPRLAERKIGEYVLVEPVAAIGFAPTRRPRLNPARRSRFARRRKAGHTQKS